MFSAGILIPEDGGYSQSPVCVVSTLSLLTERGWIDLHNITDQFQQPFQLFRDTDRTLLQVGLLVGPRYYRVSRK